MAELLIKRPVHLEAYARFDVLETHKDRVVLLDRNMERITLRPGDTLQVDVEVELIHPISARVEVEARKP